MCAAIAPPAPLPITMTFFIIINYQLSIVNYQLCPAAFAAFGYALTELQMLSWQP
jgi:hypothetical protein